MEIELPREIFEKLSSIKFNENTSSGSRADPCRPMDGRTDRQTDRQTDMTNVFAILRTRLIIEGTSSMIYGHSVVEYSVIY